MAHVKHNSGNNEWYTPKKYIESARLVMGEIDLDPASSDVANEWVKAVQYHTAEDSGLGYEWGGRVWLNPPYSKDLIRLFIDKLVASDCEYVCLVNNATETAWGSKLLEASDAVCLVKGRIRFYDNQGIRGKAPLQGQMIAYRGNNRQHFIQEFDKYGAVMVR